MNGEGWCTVKDSLTHHSRLSRSVGHLFAFSTCMHDFVLFALFLFFCFLLALLDRIIQGLKDPPLSLLYLTSVQAGAVLMPLAMFLLSLKSIRVLY